MKFNLFREIGPIQRVLISAALSVFTFFLFYKSIDDALVLSILIWDVFSFFYIITSWLVFFKSTTTEIRQYAKKEDGSRVFVFILLLLASLASMVIVMLLILSGKSSQIDQGFYIGVAIAGILLSWFIVHTTFTFHYAHIFYADDKQDKSKHAEGLNFPGEKKPEYLDFAYFAFVIGMTFQVSDVNITSRHIRRLALLHGLLSFGLNTFVVALTVNLIASLRS